MFQEDKMYRDAVKQYQRNRNKKFKSTGSFFQVLAVIGIILCVCYLAL